jgi:transposase
MTRRNKVELFEQIRREYEFGVGTIAGVAKKFGVHRRMVRQALANALPPARKSPQRNSSVLDPVREFIDQILTQDQKAPRKQRHTARRIYDRLCVERSDHPIAERTVREYVQFWNLANGKARGEIFIPQAYDRAIQAQVDWYEAVVELAGERLRLQFFSLRSMWSGAAFHQAYLHATQQAFLAAHQDAFRYFGGVFHQLRYDNLSSAVKKILRGRRREETDRFIAFRSHWQFDASFCTPGKGHEKGGVESEAGFFRRNHLVPVPQASSLAALNESLLEAGSKPLRQWREDGRWNAAYDQFCSALQSRHGESDGTRMMIELLQLGRQCGYNRLRVALEEAIRIGSSDVAVVRYLMTAREINCAPAPLDPGEIKRSEFSTRPLPALAAYDQLLSLSAQSFVKEVAQ